MEGATQKFPAFVESMHIRHRDASDVPTSPQSRFPVPLRPRMPSTTVSGPRHPGWIELSGRSAMSSERIQCSTPPRLTDSSGTLGSLSPFLNQQFLHLKSQNMVLNCLRDRVGDSSPELSTTIERILNAKYLELSDIAFQETETVRNMIRDNKADTKLVETLLSVLITISRALTSVCFGTNWRLLKRNDSTVKTMIGELAEVELPEEPEETVQLMQEIDTSEDNFICRICEEVVPLDLIETHSSWCIKAHKGQYHFFLCGERLKTVMSEIASMDGMCQNWPGLATTVVETVFPIMYYYSLLDIAQKVQIDDVEAQRQLEAIASRLSYFNVPVGAKEMMETFVLGKQLVAKKLEACKAISRAAKAISKTTRRRRFSTIGGFRTLLADFEFIDKLSSGAFARVYLSRKRRTGDLFAIKVIKKSNISLKNQVRTVSTERDIMRRLHSPYIVNFYYSFIEKHNLYLVMEYIPGGDIFSLLQNVGCLSEENTKNYTVQLVKALQYLRRNKIIHRDLKPDNILINEDGRLKLADFGLSFFGASGVNIGGDAKRVVGTPDYMAPEIILARRHDFTVDYWALGVLIFEMLCGVPPFHGDDEGDTFRRIMCGAIQWDELGEDVSPEARDLIAKLLVHNPEKRLGAGGIMEIMNHPWFNGIDWDNIDKLPPVFVPDVSRLDSYKSYFQDRYNFQRDNEKDIIEDMEQSRKKCGILGKRMMDDDDVTMQFPSVSLEQLMNSNAEIAMKVRRSSRRSSDVSPDMIDSIPSYGIKPWGSQIGDVLLESPLIASPDSESVSISEELDSPLATPPSQPRTIRSLGSRC